MKRWDCWNCGRTYDVRSEPEREEATVGGIALPGEGKHIDCPGCGKCMGCSATGAPARDAR